MKKTTQRALKDLVRTGIAQDITKHSTTEYKELVNRESGFDRISYSSGIYGINGGLIQGRNSGTLYAITARTTATQIYF